MTKADAICPICERPTSPEYRPFCSKRCADIDLHRWLSGRYAFPAGENDEADDLDGSAGQSEER